MLYLDAVFLFATNSYYFGRIPIIFKSYFMFSFMFLGPGQGNWSISLINSEGIGLLRGIR